MHQAGRYPEPRRGGLEGGEQLPVRLDTLRETGEFLGCAVGFEQPWRHAAEAGRRMGKASPLRPVGAILVFHRDPPLGLDRDGQAFPVNGNGNFHLTRTASFG